MSKALPLIIPLMAVPYDEKTAQETFQKIIKGFDPKAYVHKEKGYLFCMSRLLKGNRIINHPDSIYEGQQADQVLHKLIHIITKPDRFDDGESIVSGEILATEYKIHLMPKSDYIFPVIGAIIEACKQDKTLAELIFQIKIKCTLNVTCSNQIMPRIVIYPALGKENAEALLQKVCSIFEHYDLKEIAENLTPRYSKPINALTFYAQGSGDIKNVLSKEDQELFLSDSQVHYSWGEKLSVPKPQPEVITNATPTSGSAAGPGIKVSKPAA